MRPVSAIMLSALGNDKLNDKALEVRRDFVQGKIDLTSPALIHYEVFNALRYRPGLMPADIARFTDSILDTQMDLRLPTEDTKIVPEVAAKEKISGYATT